jgi:hypothetical protein
MSPLDKSTVQKWLTAKVEELLTADDPLKPGDEFYKKIREQIKAAGQSAFVPELGQAMAEAFDARYKAVGPSNAKPLGAVFILMTLREFGSGSAPATTTALLSAYQAAIGDRAAAVRCQAMMGLNLLGPNIPANKRADAVESVRKAATTETDSVVLDRMYKFLQALASAPAQPQDAQAILSILDARLTRIEQNSEIPFTADQDAVAWLAKNAPNNPQIQTAVARAAARLMADAVYAYVNNGPPLDLKARLELIATEAEKTLTGLYRTKVPNGTPPKPTLSELFSQGGTSLNANLTANVDKWIGSGQTAGLLTPPQAFNLPIGLGIKRPPPATSTAPAV